MNGIKKYELKLWPKASSLKQIHEQQQEALQAIKQAKLPEQLWLFECLPTLTLGRNTRAENLLRSKEELCQLGIELLEVNRGGDVTYHGPGQLMVYAMLDLKMRGKDLRKYVRCLEETVILWLASYGLTGHRDPQNPGVWVKGRKIASVGVGCSSWITYHGLGINVQTELAYFEHIVPCGIQGVRMTSLSQELGELVDMQDAQKRYKVYFEECFYESIASMV